MIFGDTELPPETVNMNLTTDMCRVCMMTSEYLKDIVSFELTAEITSMLSSFANVDIPKNECLPSLICNKCYTRLMDSINFKNKCVASNNIYKNYIMKMQKSSQENKEIPPPKSASTPLSVTTIKQEEPQRKNESEENILESINSNLEFINVKNIKEIIDEPSTELLNALGLVKVGDNKTNSDESMNSSIDSKDCIKVINNNNKNKKSYKCKMCRLVLNDYGVYRRHLATHGERPYECKICGVHFSKARALKEHTRTIHSGSKPYSCTQCSSKFVALNELTVHLRKHAGNSEPYGCNMCPKRFSNSKSLREHTSIHQTDHQPPHERYKKSTSGFGDYCCTQCDRKFRKKCDLERHERVHSGAKPYSCKVCGGRFQQAHNLTKHMVTHTGVRSFTCDVCHKTFGRSDVLTRHMHVHEVSKPFNCELCFRTFVRQSQLTSHMVKKHPKLDNNTSLLEQKLNSKVRT